jgi:hypothetical protein
MGPLPLRQRAERNRLAIRSVAGIIGVAKNSPGAALTRGSCQGGEFCRMSAGSVTQTNTCGAEALCALDRFPDLFEVPHAFVLTQKSDRGIATSLAISANATVVGFLCLPPSLPTHRPSHSRNKRFGGIDVGLPVRECLSRLAAHSMAVGGGAAGRKPVLHSRTATGLQQ